MRYESNCKLCSHPPVDHVLYNHPCLFTVIVGLSAIACGCSRYTPTDNLEFLESRASRHD